MSIEHQCHCNRFFSSGSKMHDSGMSTNEAFSEVDSEREELRSYRGAREKERRYLKKQEEAEGQRRRETIQIPDIKLEPMCLEKEGKDGKMEVLIQQEKEKIEEKKIEVTGQECIDRMKRLSKPLLKKMEQKLESFYKFLYYKEITNEKLQAEDLNVELIGRTIKAIEEESFENIRKTNLIKISQHIFLWFLDNNKLYKEESEFVQIRSMLTGLMGKLFKEKWDKFAGLENYAGLSFYLDKITLPFKMDEVPSKENEETKQLEPIPKKMLPGTKKMLKKRQKRDICSSFSREEEVSANPFESRSSGSKSNSSKQEENNTLNQINLASNCLELDFSQKITQSPLIENSGSLASSFSGVDLSSQSQTIQKEMILEETQRKSESDIENRILLAPFKKTKLSLETSKKQETCDSNFRRWEMRKSNTDQVKYLQEVNKKAAKKSKKIKSLNSSSSNLSLLTSESNLSCSSSSGRQKITGLKKQKGGIQCQEAKPLIGMEKSRVLNKIKLHEAFKSVVSDLVMSRGISVALEETLFQKSTWENQIYRLAIKKVLRGNNELLTKLARLYFESNKEFKSENTLELIRDLNLTKE